MQVCSSKENDLLKEKHLTGLESVLTSGVGSFLRAQEKPNPFLLILYQPLRRLHIHLLFHVHLHCCTGLQTDFRSSAYHITHKNMEDVQDNTSEKKVKMKYIVRRLNPEKSYMICSVRRTKGKTHRLYIYYIKKSTRSSFWRSEERLAHKSVPESFRGRRLITVSDESQCSTVTSSIGSV